VQQSGASRRVAITGIGLIGPTGTGTQTFWQALIEQRPAIRRISRFDPTSYPCQVAGEIPDKTYEDLFEPRKKRSTTHVAQLGIAATELALRDARLSPGNYPPERIGVSLGTALGGWRDGEEQHSILIDRGARRVNPFVTNTAGVYGTGFEMAAQLNAQGPHATFSSGCPASLQAVGYAALLVATGRIDVCITGGAESPITPLVFAGMCRTLELASSNGAPEKVCRPFDRGHSGIVLSEGSCILVLEPLEHALSRGARVYAEILGEASSCDGVGTYALDPTGGAAARGARHALEIAGVGPDQIDYICAHANSSPNFDRKEATVLSAALGEHAAGIPISSIKGVMGHPFGASGAFQIAAASLAMQNSLIPPTTNLDDPDPECALQHVRDRPSAVDVQTALVTSYGYGGVNGFLVLGHPDR
jgi:3-oxoacyl-[acyl-carrier-protein] synthase II